jgi:hypothetical protein
MAAIAKRSLVTVFAPTKENGLILGGGVFHGVKGRSFVGSVAKRLPRRFSAGAPKICLARGDIDPKGGFLCADRGLAHGWLLLDKDAQPLWYWQMIFAPLGAWPPQSIST